MRRISLLVSIFTVAVLVVAAAIIGLLYRTALNQEALRLEEVARSEARIIESMIRHEERFDRFVPDSSGHGDPLAATLAQLSDAHARFSGFGRTGEFTLARREGDSIVYLLSHRQSGLDSFMVIPFIGRHGEPMRRALSGLSGSVIGEDYRGATVLAAYEPVGAYGLGVAAKIDLAEIRAPFVRAGLIGLALAFATVLLGSLLFYRITNPVLRALADSEERLRKLYSSMSEGLALHQVVYDASGKATDYRILDVNPAYEAITGISRDRAIGRLASELYGVGSPPYIGTFARVAETGESAEFENDLAPMDKCLLVSVFSPGKGTFATVFTDITARRQTERQLAELAQRLTFHVENSPLAVIEWGPDMRLIRWSGGAERIFGWKAEEVLGKRMEDFRWVYVEDEPQVARVSADLQTGANPSRFSINRNYRKDGSVAVCEWYNSSLLDDAGGLHSIFSLVLDVTDRKRAEEALRTSEQKFALSFAGNPAAVGLTGLEDGIFLDVNDAWVALTGFSREEAIGHPAREMRIWPNAESARRFVEELRAAGTLRGWEQEFLKKSGEAYMAQLSAQVLTIQGKKVILSTLIDITARKRAEEALRASEERFRAVALNTPDHILVQDRELRYELVVNPQMGLTEQGMLGKTDYDFLSKSDADRLTTTKRQVMETGQTLHVATSLTSAKGELEFFEGAYVPRFDAQGRCNGIVGYFRNVTENRRAEEALRASEERFRAVSESSQVQLAVGRVSDGILLFTNPAYDEAFGYERGGLVGHRTPDLYADIADRAPLLAALEESGSVHNRDVRLKRRDGTFFWVSLSLRLIRFAGEPAILSSSVDISRRKENEARIARLQRLYSVLSLVNEAIVRIRDEAALVERLCAIVAQDGGFPLVWVGRVKGQEVRPVAACGPEVDYMKDVRVEVTGTLGSGPTGTCIREDRPVVNDDFDTNAATAPWREPARRHGFRASVALPLRRGGRAEGALTIYARERGAFDAEEIGLLESLAADISYAFDALEAERGRLQTVEALRESEATLRLAQQGASSGTWDWDVATGNIKWTPEMFAVFGLDPDKDAASFETWGRILHPDDAAVASARIEAALKEHTPLGSEYRIIRPDGKLRWIWATGEGKYDSSGSPVRMVGVCQDITGRKQAEEALRRNEATQRGILDATKESVWLFSTDGIVLQANAMALTRFGKAGPEVIGKPLEEILSPELARSRRARVQEVAESAAPVEFEDERAGIQFRHSFYPVTDTSGHVVAVASFSRDITASRRADQALRRTLEDLRRSNDDLEQFAYAASHDLQQPLRMVASYVGLLSQRYRAQLDEKADRYIDYAVGGAKRMQALVDGLLHYSRVGTRGGAVTKLDAAAVVAEAQANLSECVKECGAVIEIGALPEVAADRSQMVQLFQNLLDNAIKFRGPATPVVSVTCRDDGDQWEFAVRDNGIGIDPKHAERVFEVFKRLHTEQEYPGTGIGLALCRKIVERHGGRIWLEPAQGSGSVFRFTLPKRPAAAYAEPAGAATKEV